MKRNQSLFLLSWILLLASCSTQVEEIVTYKVNEPIYMSADEFRSSVKVKQQPQGIKQHGKIAFFNGYLYISEPEVGIHIIDNRNPAYPSQIGFIELIGNVDMAIKDNILYADSYIDMVWFDLSNPALPVLKGRAEDVFPYAIPETDNTYWQDYNVYEDKSKGKGVIVGWNVTERSESYWRNRYSWLEEIFSPSYTSDVALLDNSSGVGKTGSMSRFAINDNYLYTVMNNQLSVFNIENNKPEKAGDDFYVGWDVETIFSYKNNLFMGTPIGLMIYSAENPLTPEYKSSIVHVYGCDPVVVEDDIAYVTVHSGNNCGQNNNQLIVIDVNDVSAPKAIVTYEMTKPKGLGIDNKTLFVCDEGLKVYDATNPKGIMVNELSHFKNMEGYDVIAHNNVLMMIASDGIYQYDYSNIKNIVQISKIAIGK